MFDWANAGIDAIEGLYEAIRSKVLSDWHINIDETVQKLLDTGMHKCRNIYDWGLISKTHKLMYFKTYIAESGDILKNGSRGQKVLDDEIKDYKWHVLQSDGYLYLNMWVKEPINILRIYSVWLI